MFKRDDEIAIRAQAALRAVVQDVDGHDVGAFDGVGNRISTLTGAGPLSSKLAIMGIDPDFLEVEGK